MKKDTFLQLKSPGKTGRWKAHNFLSAVKERWRYAENRHFNMFRVEAVVVFLYIWRHVCLVSVMLWHVSECKGLLRWPLGSCDCAEAEHFVQQAAGLRKYLLLLFPQQTGSCLPESCWWLSRDRRLGGFMERQTEGGTEEHVEKVGYLWNFPAMCGAACHCGHLGG